jgi:hypothetical protein
VKTRCRPARFLYYELVQRGVLQKHGERKDKKGRRPDQDLHDALTYLCERDIIPCMGLDHRRDPVP